jgi:hypothetical protein
MCLWLAIIIDNHGMRLMQAAAMFRAASLCCQMPLHEHSCMTESITCTLKSHHGMRAHLAMPHACVATIDFNRFWRVSWSPQLARWCCQLSRCGWLS